MKIKHYYPSKFFLLSRRIRVDLLSYESKTIDKREQYSWSIAKYLYGVGHRYHREKNGDTLLVR